MSKKNIDFFIYVRKSSEDEGRQVASIPSQIEELKLLASKKGLNVVDVFVEEKSAKAPGREVFNEMLMQINEKKATGILCWKLDRLARNPIDSGNVSWMLQQQVLDKIVTFEKEYNPEDNVLLMGVEFGVANQYVIDLSINVKRGMRKRVADGWFPHIPPLGYQNNTHKLPKFDPIYPDNEKFHLMKSLWDELIENRCSLNKLYKKACETGLRSRKGNLIPKSHFFELFKNPFYYGSFTWNGDVYKGKHKPMITKAEFDLAQDIISGKRTSKPKYKEFLYTGVMHCGECGSGITAESKTKKQKNGNVHNYIYYRCTKRKKSDSPCTQKTIREEILEDQMIELLDHITIPKEFHDWAIRALKEEQKRDGADRESRLSEFQSQQKLVDRKLETIFSMRMNNELTADEYLKKKESFKKEKDHLEQLIQDTHYRFDTWLERAEQLLDFSKVAKKRFEEGDIKTKQGILQAIGSHLYLKDRTLHITLREPLNLVKDISPEVKAVVKRLEPLVYTQKRAENDLNSTFSEKWWR